MAIITYEPDRIAQHIYIGYYFVFQISFTFKEHKYSEICQPPKGRNRNNSSQKEEFLCGKRKIASDCGNYKF